MAVVVEHEKRKHEILAKSLDLFIDEGYEDVTFQKIADRCGITRTTLYIYFKNKREIFIWSIKELTQGLEVRLRELIADESLSSIDCLNSVLDVILDSCESNKKLFKILLVYLIQIQKTGENAGKRISRRVIRLKHLLNVILIRGQEAGEIVRYPIKTIIDMIYSLLESSVFRLAVAGDESLDESRALFHSFIENLRNTKSA
ncbi:MAG: TetR/AcrR family transcriptional regulator [Treponema sp.]|nr:TetR/AcrR family transcriptional regulator [Treponema sp.]